MDIATLTGACIIALGGEVGGMFTPSDDMADSLVAASNTAGEKVWRMPMEASYAEQLKSSVADMKNTGSLISQPDLTQYPNCKITLSTLICTSRTLR